MESMRELSVKRTVGRPSCCELAGSLLRERSQPETASPTFGELSLVARRDLLHLRRGRMMRCITSRALIAAWCWPTRAAWSLQRCSWICWPRPMPAWPAARPSASLPLQRGRSWHMCSSHACRASLSSLLRVHSLSPGYSSRTLNCRGGPCGWPPSPSKSGRQSILATASDAIVPTCLSHCTALCPRASGLTPPLPRTASHHLMAAAVRLGPIFSLSTRAQGRL